jgi:hypothetical protein
LGQVGLAGAGFVYSLAEADNKPNGAALEAAGSVVVGQSARVGASVAWLGEEGFEAVPVAGNVFSGFLALTDLGKAVSIYKQCMEE